ncbi:MAG: TIGR02444 family protein [Pseudorhodoplanes sp.]
MTKRKRSPGASAAAAPLALSHPFWRFSIAVYRQPDVAQECLALQSALDIDVNVLLFGAWLGAERRLRLDKADIGKIARRVARWHKDTVRPLRAIRQDLKRSAEIVQPGVQSLRKKVAAIELLAEQIEQAMLFRMASTIGRSSFDPPHLLVADNMALIIARATRKRAKSFDAPALAQAAARRARKPSR